MILQTQIQRKGDQNEEKGSRLCARYRRVDNNPVGGKQHNMLRKVYSFGLVSGMTSLQSNQEESRVEGL
ncbi:hypothetical protein NPIL_624181 [Nephila pilipes]|uniref:Uncharacterized protein n=1 Tax=Nephila pilipes TaxID=299642 RepID=A0A8X6NEB9_NEPPI|nr:hypothetical protein NPIL_624181 [Nephila pilipes]